MTQPTKASLSGLCTMKAAISIFGSMMLPRWVEFTPRRRSRRMHATTGIRNMTQCELSLLALSRSKWKDFWCDALAYEALGQRLRVVRRNVSPEHLNASPEHS